MENIYLSDLCAFLQMDFTFSDDFLVKGISIDTRTIRPGEVFLALKGENYDGHAFLPVAVKKGAGALIVEEDFQGKMPVLRVPNTLEALAQIANGYRQRLGTKVIAITGSSGKTTTKNLLAHLLATKYKVISTYKNFNNEIGLPLSIFGLTAEHEVAVFELGMNRLGEIAKLSKIASPDIAIITNIGTAHLGNLGSRENILRAKAEIKEGLRGCLILNSDDPFLKKITWPQIIGAGVRKNAGNYVFVDHWEMSKEGLNFTVVRGKEKIELFLPLQGKHNLNNALLAITCAFKMGLTGKEIKTALANFVNENWRYEESVFKGITLIKDFYSANPDSVKAALATLCANQSKGKKLAILGEMNELGEFSSREHRHLGELCRELSLLAFFVGDHYRDFEEGYGQAGFAFKTKSELYGCLQEYVMRTGLKEGDVVLLKGSRQIKMEEVFQELKKYLEMDYRHDLVFTLPPAAVTLYMNTRAMQSNLKRIKEVLANDVEIMPIIKAGAYGSSTDIVVNAFHMCNYLAVADVQEALVLKRIFPEKEIMILYQPLAVDLPLIMKHDFIVGLGYWEFAREVKSKQPLRVHLEIDTGAGRLGINPREVKKAARELKKLSNVQVEGLYMHYVCADSMLPADQEYTVKQTEIFKKAVWDFEEIYGLVRFKHASSSVPIFTQKEAHFNLVRPGYMIYGYYPADVLRERVTLTPALQLAARIIQIKTVPPGTFISYGRTFETTRESVIATVAIGYADGISRLLSNQGSMVVNGQRAPIVGRICMDLTMLDITDIVGEVKVGDQVYVFDNYNVTLDEVAKWSKTIGYEVLTRIAANVERVEKI